MRITQVFSSLFFIFSDSIFGQPGQNDLNLWYTKPAEFSDKAHLNQLSVQPTFQVDFSTKAGKEYV